MSEQNSLFPIMSSAEAAVLDARKFVEEHKGKMDMKPIDDLADTVESLLRTNNPETIDKVKLEKKEKELTKLLADGRSQLGVVIPE